MLGLAFGLLCAAALIGGGLAIRYMRRPLGTPPPGAVLYAHAALGAASLAVLLLALTRGQPPAAMGTAGFGPAAAVLQAATLALGLLLARAAWRGRRPNELLVGTHAALAVAALVLLLTLLALR